MFDPIRALIIHVIALALLVAGAVTLNIGLMGLGAGIIFAFTIMNFSMGGSRPAPTARRSWRTDNPQEDAAPEAERLAVEQPATTAPPAPIKPQASAQSALVEPQVPVQLAAKPAQSATHSSQPADKSAPATTPAAKQRVAERSPQPTATRPASATPPAQDFTAPPFTPKHPFEKLHAFNGKLRYLYRSVLITGTGSTSVQATFAYTLHIDLPYGPAYGDGPGEVPYCRWFGIGFYGPGVDPNMPPVPQGPADTNGLKDEQFERLVLPQVTAYIDRHYQAFAPYVPRDTATLARRYAQEDQEASRQKSAKAAQAPGRPQKPSNTLCLSGARATRPYEVALYGNGYVDGDMVVDEVKGICTLKESELTHMSYHGTDTEYSNYSREMSLEDALHLLKHRPSDWLSHTPPEIERGVQELIARLEALLNPQAVDAQLLRLAQDFYGGDAQGQAGYTGENSAVVVFDDPRPPYAQLVVKVVRIKPEGREAYARLGDALVQMTSGEQAAHGLVPVMRAGVVEGEGGPYALMLMPRATPVVHPSVRYDRHSSEWSTAFAAGHALATALSVLHGRGYVHMDVKPDNTFKLEGVSEGGWALGDFGSVREVGFVAGKGQSLTWTSAYAAPEVDGKTPCAATMDVYAWGRTMFRILNRNHWEEIDPGPVSIILNYTTDDFSSWNPRLNVPDEEHFLRLLNGAPTAHEGRRRRESGKPIRTSYRGYLFTRVVMRAMDPDPQRRFADGSELLRELALVEAAATKQDADGLLAIGDVVARCAGGQQRVTIPRGTTRIFHGAFRSNGDLREVIVPASVTSIEPYAFWRCQNLEVVRFEGAVPELDATAFEGCGGLRQVSVRDESTIYRLPGAMRTLALNARGLRGRAAQKLLKAHLGDALQAAQAAPQMRPVVNFGAYRWQVIGVRDGRMLLLAQTAVDCRPFDAKTDEWQDSDMRAYLNGPFFNEGFSDFERALIDRSELLTDGSKSEDHVFLLSLEELTEFLPVEADRDLYSSSSMIGPWWLRSKAVRPPSSRIKPAVLYVTDEGIGMRPFSGLRRGKLYVRPALWVKAGGLGSARA